MLRHMKSLGFRVRLAGDDKHVVFAARDPKTGDTLMAKGNRPQLKETLSHLPANRQQTLAHVARVARISLKTYL